VEFSQEQFLVSHSVTGIGSGLQMQSDAPSPLDFVDRPAGTQVQGVASVEASTQPLFDGLSQATLGAAHYRFDSRTLILAMAGIVGTDGIAVRPLLTGTREARLNQPDLRPGDCADCTVLSDQVYLGAINAQRSFQGFLPRSGLASQPIPFAFIAGLTTKYFWEELEGDDYLAQALNLDAGLQLEIGLDYDPVSNQSQRDLIFEFSGFELLPTSQRSEIDGFVKEERGENRWHLGLSWREAWPSLASGTRLGITQKSEGGKWPGIAVEGNFKRCLFLRTGYDGSTWASGMTLNWRMIGVHYAMQKHPLGMTWYQLALQAAWPP